MDEKKDHPIVPQDYLRGTKVVDIGELRVARGLSRRPHSACQHNKLVYDIHERRIWCSECETNIDGFDAFQQIVAQFASAHSALAERQQAVERAEKHSARSIAVKKLDEVWRSRNKVPCCPHCGEGLLPEDIGKRGLSSVNAEWIRAKRKRTPHPARPERAE